MIIEKVGVMIMEGKGFSLKKAFLLGVSIFSIGFTKDVKAEEKFFTDLTKELPQTIERNVSSEVSYDGTNSMEITGLTGISIDNYNTPHPVYNWTALDQANQANQYKVYCIDSTKQLKKGTVLNKSNDEVSYNLAYLIAHSYPYVKDASLTEAENVWISQMAVWKMLNDASADNAYAGLTDKKLTADAETQTRYLGTNTVAALWTKVQAKINEATNVVKPEDTTIEFVYDDGFTLSDDKQSLKSNLISIKTNQSDYINSYGIDISKAPSGTKVYNENNEEITDLSSINPNTKIYLVVPVSNSEAYNFDFNVTLTGNYTFYKGNKYYPTDSTQQPVVLINKESKVVTAEISLHANRVPDTASNVSTSIYFIGFIILLTGAGIVYANVKTQKRTN